MSGNTDATETPIVPGPAMNERLRRGGWAIAGAQAASQLVSLVVLGVLFRLLDPTDFGLLAIITPVLAFWRLIASLGLNIATVQSRSLSAAEADALFWVNLISGSLAALAAAATAPALAWLFGEAKLTSLGLALSGTSIVVALGAQHVALAERQLLLSEMAAARLLAQAGGGAAAVACAMLGAGPWALVAQPYVELALVSLGGMLLTRWWPGPPQRGANIVHLLHFGGHYTAANLLFFISQNFDKLFLGYFLGPLWLGYYNQAYTLMMRPVLALSTAFSSLMLPALARAAHDREALGGYVAAFYRLVALVSLPSGVGLWLLADDAMPALGGEAWRPANPLLAGLALASTVHTAVNLCGSVWAAEGKARPLLWGSVAFLLATTLGYAIGYFAGRFFGHPATGVAWGYGLSIVVLSVPYVSLCLYSAGVGPWHWLREIRRPIAATAGMAMAVSLARAGLVGAGLLAPMALALAQVGVGVVVYGILVRRELREFSRIALGR